MANPVTIICPEDEWKKVASSVTIGQVKKLSKKPSLYLETYRTAGATAPTSITEGAIIFRENDYESISASAAIDVYIMARGNDGKVRVDLP